jgi:phosphate starvation-inducible protein PhoH and related proteins
MTKASVNLRTPASKLYHNELRSNRPLVIAIGPAGSGKTMHACKYAMESLRNSAYQHVVITRPIVPVEDEHLGYLPGDLNCKMEPWISPVWNNLKNFASSPNELEQYFQQNRVEIAPLGMMRGRTFQNALVIGDEMQNSSVHQMKMLLTRLGENSRMILTGDIEQSDIPHKNGLVDFIERVDENSSHPLVSVVKMDMHDVYRSAIAKEILKIYM